MTQFNPITGAILVNQQLVTRQATAQTTHIKRTQALQKNIAAQGDRFESEVESTEKIDPAHDQKREQPQQRKRRTKNTSVAQDVVDNSDGRPSLDLTA